MDMIIDDSGSILIPNSVFRCIGMFEPEERTAVAEELLDCFLTGRQTDNPAVYMMLRMTEENNRCEKETVSDENRKKKPGRYIEPAEWQSYYENHTREETAAHFGISVNQLRYWIKKTEYKKFGAEEDTDPEKAPAPVPGKSPERGSGKRRNNIININNNPVSDPVTKEVTGSENRVYKANETGRWEPGWLPPGLPPGIPPCPGFTLGKGELLISEPHTNPTGRWYITVRTSGGEQEERLVNKL